MANKKQIKVEKAEQDLKKLESALTSSEAFLEKNQKSLLYVLTGVVALIVCWLLVDNLVIKPKSLEAEEQMALGHAYFMDQNYDTAINGDSIEFIGYASIADEYYYTFVGNLANAYTGLSYFKLADYDNAIVYLEKFMLRDSYLYYTVQNTLGDCYAMKGETDKAIACFEDAAGSGNLLVDVATLMKIARAYESKGDYASALAQYKEIKSNYEGLMTGLTDLDEIDKYIENATLKNGK